MNKKIIYLVEKTTGSYEDRFTEIVKASFDREKIKKYISDKETEYKDIYEISKIWEKEWTKDESHKESFEEEESFIEYLKEKFPLDVERFGIEKLRQAYDLYERGILDDCPFYTTVEIEVDSDND